MASSRKETYLTRKEQDVPEIVSGLFDGKSTGAPLSIIFKNTNAKSHNINT